MPQPNPPRPQGQRPNSPEIRELPPPAKVTYFTSPGVPREQLLDSEAATVAKAIQGVEKTQLRRFFEDVMSIRRRLEHFIADESVSKADAFARLRAEFKMLRAKAAYAQKRLGAKHFPDKLLQFFTDHTYSVSSAEDFEVFCKHFEAVLAFHRWYSADQQHQ